MMGSTYPRHHTNGIMEYMRANVHQWVVAAATGCEHHLTLVFFHGNQLGKSGLKDADVPITHGHQLEVLLRGVEMWIGRGAYPLSRPPNALPSSATGRFRAKPKTNMLRHVPASPPMSTGFRPILSLNFPQITPVENSANAKAEVTSPA